MSVLHGPIPMKTLGELRKAINDMSALDDATTVAVLFSADDIEDTPSVDGEIHESSGLTMDAATEGSIVVWPWNVVTDR